MLSGSRSSGSGLESLRFGGTYETVMVKTPVNRPVQAIGKLLRKTSGAPIGLAPDIAKDWHSSLR